MLAPCADCVRWQNALFRPITSEMNSVDIGEKGHGTLDRGYSSPVICGGRQAWRFRSRRPPTFHIALIGEVSQLSGGRSPCAICHAIPDHWCGAENSHSNWKGNNYVPLSDVCCVREKRKSRMPGYSISAFATPFELPITGRGWQLAKIR